MLNKEITTKWVAALRSGEYKQAKKVLQAQDGGMCCLGVLCDLYQKETGKGAWGTGVEKDKITNAVGKPFDLNGTTVVDFPSGEVFAWAGFTTERLSGDGFKRKVHCEFGSFLAGSNDSGVTFDEIANLIEERIEEEEQEAKATLTPTS